MPESCEAGLSPKEIEDFICGLAAASANTSPEVQKPDETSLAVFIVKSQMLLE